MSGVQIELTLQGVEAAAQALGRLSSMDLDDLAFSAGQLLEASTRERIASTKTAPDGSAWEPWAPATAEHRGGHQSLLLKSGHLLGSVQNYTSGWTVKIGSNMVYAAIHQEGGQAGRDRAITIPARPYLGLSDEDEQAINDLIEDTIGGMLQ